MPGRDLSAELFGDAKAPTADPSAGRDLSQELFGKTSAPAARNWSGIPMEALGNLPSSAGNFVSGIAQAVRHPIDTAGNLLDVGAGALHNALPKSWSAAIDSIDPNPGAGKKAVQAADAAGAFFKDRYGSVEGLKKTLATDPVGVASDASTVLLGGAGLANLGGKAARMAALRGVPGAGTGSALLTGAGDALQTAGIAANPITLAGKAVAKVAPVVGEGAANLIGGLGTHTGAESIKQAFRSGREGGNSAQSFADNMRGNVPMTDVLDTAKANLEQMGRDKSAAYRAGMAQVSGDKTVLDFTGIDQAISDAAKVATFKGQVKNTKAAQVQQAIADTVDEWKALDPAEYHTPEGLDALKQKIGGIVESIPFEEKTAGLVGKKIYNAVKTEIVNQAPVYADTMKGYTEASDQIREIERALSLGNKASVDTAMRKLQSLTRNNVNTNYGNRLDLARQLEQQGGQELMPALSGQALSSWTPRGLGGATAAGVGMGGWALGGPQLAIPALAVQSPRLMGEVALAAGKGIGLLDSAKKMFTRQPSAPVYAPQDTSMKLASPGPLQPAPAIPYQFPKNIDIWSLADDVPNGGRVPDTQRLATTHDYPTVDFPLRQEVLQQPDIAAAVEAFRTQANKLQQVANNAISKPVRAKAQADLDKLQQEFAAGMKQLGISNAADAHGLRRPLYDTGSGTRLPIQHTFTPGQ